MTFLKNRGKSPLLWLLLLILIAGLLLFIYTRPARPRSDEDYIKHYQVKDIKDSGPLWTIDQYEALTEDDTTLTEVIDMHGLADEVDTRRGLSISYRYSEGGNHLESQVIILNFSRLDEKLISKSYRHENSSYFENKRSMNFNFDWTKEEYDQIVISDSDLATNEIGAKYTDIIDKHGLSTTTTLSAETNQPYYELVADYRNSSHSNDQKNVSIYFRSKTFDGPYTAYDKESANFD